MEVEVFEDFDDVFAVAFSFHYFVAELVDVFDWLECVFGGGSGVFNEAVDGFVDVGWFEYNAFDLCVFFVAVGGVFPLTVCVWCDHIEGSVYKHLTL